MQHRAVYRYGRETVQMLKYQQAQGGNQMATKIKPVQPTEIKDIKIIREVIAEIRQKPTKVALKRHKLEEEDLLKLLKK